jgi:hypothetical protein
VTRQLRLVVFSQSIISDIGNPQATTVRAMCQAFADAGHDITHLEQRGNPALMRMLKFRGYAPMRTFNERYPRIRYRQYDLLTGTERAVWFGRETAVADAVVAYPGTPNEVVSELQSRDTASVLRFWSGASDQLVELLPLWTEPAVLVRDTSGPRDERCVVAYDDEVSIDRPGWLRISAGSVAGADWSYVPEALIEDRYQHSLTVALDDSVELARALLPVANGAATELIDRAGNTARTLTDVPAGNNARVRAERLSAEIKRMLAERIGLRR